MPRRNPDWMTFGLDMWALGFEASAVVGLRMMKLAVGGAAAGTEAQRMVSEKVRAALELQAMAVTGGLGTSIHDAAERSVKHYRRAVRANRRRLGR